MNKISEAMSFGYNGSNILTPMNHREIEYIANKLMEEESADSGKLIDHVSDSFSDYAPELKKKAMNMMLWLEENGSRLFDDDLIMDYGTDCLRLYLLFENMPKENDKYYDSWQEGALEGIYKFLGKVRRTMLVATFFNVRGYYEQYESADLEKIRQAIRAADIKISKCLDRENTMPNRHNIVTALMEALKVMQKELKIGELTCILHSDAIKDAVPHENSCNNNPDETVKNIGYNEKISEICSIYIRLIMPYAPYLSQYLLKIVKSYQ